MEKFRDNIKRQLALLRKMNLNVEEIFPSIFYKREMKFEVVYSVDKEHILIRIISSDKFDYNFNIINGDVIDYFDKSGVWAKSQAVFKIQNSNINIKKISIQGMKPFSIDGQVFITVDQMKFNLPNNKIVNLEYTNILSYKIFLEKLKNIQGFVDNILFTYLDYFKTYNKKLNLNENTKIDEYKNNLKIVENEFSRLINNNDTKELEIDKFIEKNPIILEKGLDIINPIHQVILRDILNEYGQDLKPDVIGLNKYTKNWNIIDYKRANKNLIKNNDKVRCSFKSEVNDLEAQLRDYKEYFDESLQREYFYNKYKVNIEYPETIGIIGFIAHGEECQFNRLISDKPRWFNVRTYKYLEEKFHNYIQDLMSLN